MYLGGGDRVLRSPHGCGGPRPWLTPTAARAGPAPINAPQVAIVGDEEHLGAAIGIDVGQDGRAGT